MRHPATHAPPRVPGAATQPTVAAETIRDRRVLIVSPDHGRRRRWGDFYRRSGAREILNCAGPEHNGCALYIGDRSCQALQRADVAIYDVAGLTPAFVHRLLKTGAPIPIAFARDAHANEDPHQPSVIAISSPPADPGTGSDRG